MRSKYRLKANADFQHLRRQGHTLHHPLLVISFLPNGLEYSRFGFIVGKRLGKATVRNRIKRRLREAVRLRLRRGEIAEGWDVVFIARRPIREASFRQMDRAVGQLLRRARLTGDSLRSETN